MTALCRCFCLLPHRFEVAAQQNMILDVFFNDWQALNEEDGIFGGKAETHLKEYQSFTDLHFTKEKTISDINWHPTINGETTPYFTHSCHSAVGGWASHESITERRSE